MYISKTLQALPSNVCMFINLLLNEAYFIVYLRLSGRDGFIQRTLEKGKEAAAPLDITLGTQTLTIHFLGGFSTGIAALGLNKTPLTCHKTVATF